MTTPEPSDSAPPEKMEQSGCRFRSRPAGLQFRASGPSDRFEDPASRLNLIPI
jgi:hypothetical protein